MYCPKCGVEMPENAASCSRCKTSVTASSPATVAAEKVKTASKDALEAFKRFASNPVGGLAPAFEGLGQSRALGVGFAFGAVFAACMLVTAHRFLPEWGRPRFFFFRMLVFSMAPFIATFGVGAALRKMFRGEGGVGADSFIAGASLLPLGFAMLLTSVLGFGNIEIIGLLALIGICVTILMLFAALTRIYRLSERAGTPAVPLMAIAVAWVAKAIYTALL